MDASAVNINVTVDDFDAIVNYADQSQWFTPDPSSADFDAKASPWWMGTFHKTESIGASFSFNFTGPAIYIYGQKGPDYGSFSVELDSNSQTLSAYATENGTAPVALFSTNSLSYSNHQLTIKNLGKQGQDGGGNAFMFDSLQNTVQVAPAGASVNNSTVQEDNSTLTYSGTWGSNKSGNFSGGGSSFTNGDGASVSLKFHGSTIWVFGDKKNDHGLYSAVLDNDTQQTFNGVSGCGGAFGMTCEQQQPCIKYFASNLDGSEHTLTITNMAGVNQSFFDLDSIVISVPSEYAPRNLSGSASSSSTGGAQPTTTGSGSQNNAAVALHVFNPLLLIFASLCLFTKRFH
ncbi:hypothetical protein QCA50_001095 [Cerrena zonata]|uniref:Uncharacterized protein n=1 Tax=Cerrena zonata TaxID=2478898 RepID=A0AAW0GZ11_9APHY